MTGRRPRKELHVVRDDLDGVPPLALLVLPGTAAEPPVDGDASALPEISRACLGLLAPRGDADEVRARLLPAPIHPEQKARHLLVVPDLAKVHVGGQVPDQRHDVHT